MISQATVALNMRRTRYRGQDKTHLQKVATASAINLLRALNWLIGQPKAKHVSRLLQPWLLNYEFADSILIMWQLLAD